MPAGANDKKKGAATESSTGAIAGGVVGGFCGLVILGAVAWRVRHVQLQRKGPGDDNDILALSALYVDNLDDLRSSQNQGKKTGKAGSFV
jgi:hypothetical protein